MKFNVEENGKLIECEVMFTFQDESNNINYIVYTDGTKDDLGDDKIYASRYMVENDKYILKSIENDCEWDLIDNYISSEYKKVS